ERTARNAHLAQVHGSGTNRLRLERRGGKSWRQAEGGCVGFTRERSKRYRRGGRGRDLEKGASGRGHRAARSRFRVHMGRGGGGGDHARGPGAMRAPRFVADAMLGRVARWLRVLGFDVVYDPTLHDAALVQLAEADDRILLTRDRQLLRDRRPPRAIEITSDT